jgi:hypothetical protein
LVLEGALRSSADCFHHATWSLVPWWSQLVGNVMAAESWRIALVVWVFVTEDLASWFLTCSSDMVSGGDSTWEVQGPTLQGENPRSALIGCVWQLPYLRHCFMSADFSPGWKPKIYDRATMLLVHCSFLEALLFGVGLLVLSWWC